MFRTFSRYVLTHRKTIIFFVALLCAVSVVAMVNVSVTYDLAAYLPEDSPSAKALDIIGQDVPNMQLYVPDVSIQQALTIKKELLTLPRVKAVMWMDDTFNLTGMPMEMIPGDVLSGWYRDGGALFRVTIDPNDYVTGFHAIREKYPDSIAAGNAANQARIISVNMQEVGKIIPYVLPIVLIILLLSTTHYIDPILFLVTIGVAILINEGTNVFLGNVSFVTRASAAVLQLAVSIDYAVFLLHRYEEYRAKGYNNHDAMLEAMVQSASAIAASAMTTVFGFLVLLLMRFGIGMDMGIVMAKGVLISYLSVIIFLPALILELTNVMDKSAHRSFLPSFKKFSTLVVKRGLIVVLLIILLIPLSFLAQNQNNYLFGSGGMHAEDSVVKLEVRKIQSLFGSEQEMMLLVKEGQLEKVKALSEKLKEIPAVKTVVSYSTAVGNDLPVEMVPQGALSMLRADGYDRIMFYADVPEEGKSAFSLVEEVRALAQNYYGEDYHFLGEPAVNYDIKNIITEDNPRVLWGGIIAIGVILLITFRSLSLPFILLFTIEGAIWINMALPYFQGHDLNYIGYQIVSSVQLGATIDYAILLTQRYLEKRSTANKKESAIYALSQSVGSILPPALILVVAGLFLGFISTNGVISQMGIILGRGAALSCAMVIFMLPHLLVIFDSLILKTTKGVSAPDNIKS
jgi:predicted RND superfamily exporter protein